MRVARWVREVVPEPFLPKDDEAFLPELHYLKDWDASLRELVPYETTWRIDGHSPPPLRPPAQSPDQRSG